MATSSGIVKVLKDYVKYAVEHNQYNKGGFFNISASDFNKLSPEEQNGRRVLQDLLQNVAYDRSGANLGVLSELLNLIDRVDDKEVKHFLLGDVIDRCYGYVQPKLSKMEKDMIESFATDKNATVADKIRSMELVYNPHIMESMLAMLRKEISTTVFNEKYPDMKKLRAILNQLNLDYILLEYKEYKPKIRAEFNEDAILAKYGNNRAKLDQPAYMLQTVIPGMEKDINYDEDVPEYPEMPKESEQIQSTIRELQLEQEIEELKKKLQQRTDALRRLHNKDEQEKKDIKRDVENDYVSRFKKAEADVQSILSKLDPAVEKEYAARKEADSAFLGKDKKRADADLAMNERKQIATDINLIMKALKVEQNN